MHTFILKRKEGCSVYKCRIRNNGLATLPPDTSNHHTRSYNKVVFTCSIKRLYLPFIDCISQSLSDPSSRISNWIMKIQGYDMTVIHRPGKDNPADYMSRHPGYIAPHTRTDNTEEYVNFLKMNAIPNAITLEEIKRETARDAALQSVIEHHSSDTYGIRSRTHTGHTGMLEMT